MTDDRLLERIEIFIMSRLFSGFMLLGRKFAGKAKASASFFFNEFNKELRIKDSKDCFGVVLLYCLSAGFCVVFACRFDSSGLDFLVTRAGVPAFFGRGVLRV